MKHIQNVQRTITYIEDHLIEYIDINALTKELNITYKTITEQFTAVVGLDIEEYINQRRLTECLKDIKLGHLKMTEIAHKYQYANIDQFTDHFKSFHHVSPIRSKQKGVKTNYLSPLSVSLDVRPLDHIHYEIISPPPLNITGVKISVSKSEYLDVNLKYNFLLNIKKSGILDDILTLYDGHIEGIFIITIPLGDYIEYMIGVSSKTPSNRFEYETLYPHRYSVFELVGPLKHATQDALDFAYQQWSIKSGFNIIDDITIERITFDATIDHPEHIAELWLPIE
ncbi:AraC family transcriptional regulator [Abyssicoccus albus]|uniref:AraC family transcriptional regulator n=1 Tax=Abyssicoccus albus TaxID=1817405 RepID=A0A3N5CJV4_9BACL|nr:helix-turn-helix domain-containing protein [Abyssicoccus albus]RPF58061.1 AraC family transcriptional regulator [Abyssicoccus albus]